MILNTQDELEVSLKAMEKGASSYKDVREMTGADELYVKYHDEEWGVPVHDDKKHFEFLKGIVCAFSKFKHINYDEACKDSRAYCSK